MSLVTRYALRAATAVLPAAVHQLPGINLDMRRFLSIAPHPVASFHPSRTPFFLSPSRQAELRSEFERLQDAVFRFHPSSHQDCITAKYRLIALQGMPLQAVASEREIKELAGSLISAGRRHYANAHDPDTHFTDASYLFLSNAWDMVKEEGDLLLGHQVAVLSISDATRINAHLNFVTSLLAHPHFSKAPPSVQAALKSDAAVCHIIFSGSSIEQRQEHLRKAVDFYKQAAELDGPYKAYYSMFLEHAESLLEKLPPFKTGIFLKDPVRLNIFIENLRLNYPVHDGGPINLISLLHELVDTTSSQGQEFLDALASFRNGSPNV